MGGNHQRPWHCVCGALCGYCKSCYDLSSQWLNVCSSLCHVRLDSKLALVKFAMILIIVIESLLRPLTDESLFLCLLIVKMFDFSILLVHNLPLFSVVTLLTHLLYELTEHLVTVTCCPGCIAPFLFP